MELRGAKGPWRLLSTGADTKTRNAASSPWFAAHWKWFIREVQTVTASRGTGASLPDAARDNRPMGRLGNVSSIFPREASIHCNPAHDGQVVSIRHREAAGQPVRLVVS